jgi:hypothetical protein
MPLRECFNPFNKQPHKKTASSNVAAIPTSIRKILSEKISKDIPVIAYLCNTCKIQATFLHPDEGKHVAIFISLAIFNLKYFNLKLNRVNRESQM